MTDKAMRPLALLLVTTALPHTGVLAAEPLPPRALARIGDHRFYHGPGITCAVLSPDGSHIASAARDPIIVLWDATTGERLRELRLPRGSISCLAFSPDGKRLAAAYGNPLGKFGVAVFEFETDKLLRQLGDFKREVSYLQFSADGKQLRVSESLGPVSAWDTASGKQLRLWKPPPETPPKGNKDGVGGVRGVLSPDGKVVVWEMGLFRERGSSRDSISLRVHDAKTNELLYQKKFKIPLSLRSFAFSPDSRRFAAYCDKITLWETATGKELVALELPHGVQFGLAPDGRRAVIHEQVSRLRLWDLETGKPLRDLYGGFGDLKYELLKTPQIFSADGKTLLLATDSTLRLFDMRIGEERAVPGHRAAVTPRFSADGRTLFTSCGERRCSWDVSPGKEPALLTHYSRKSWEVGCLSRSADDRLFLDRSERRGRVRETATGLVLCELEDEYRIVVKGQFSPDTTRVLLCKTSDRSGGVPDVFLLYDVQTGKASGKIKTMDQAGYPVFSPNGHLVAWTDRANAIHLHDAITGKVMRTLRSSRPLPKIESNNADLLSPESYNNHADLLFSPDSEYLIERRPTLPMRMFQVSSGREIGRFYANPEKKSEAGPLSHMAWSPDNRLLAVAEKEAGTVRLLEIASGKVRAEFPGHRHGVHGLAFAPDGKTLASGGEDNVVFLWDVTGAKTLAYVKKTPVAWWNDLASEDGKRAGDAIAGLLRKPEASVAFLQERLRPTEATDEKRLTQLLADLDGDAFEKREAASRELAQFGEQAEAALRRALKDRPSLEMRRRLEDLLDKLEHASLPPETLRILRAIEILEHHGTPEARRCLDALAEGAPQARQTQEAKKALNRLAKRR